MNLTFDPLTLKAVIDRVASRDEILYKISVRNKQFETELLMNQLRAVGFVFFNANHRGSTARNNKACAKLTTANGGTFT